MAAAICRARSVACSVSSTAKALPPPERASSAKSGWLASEPTATVKKRAREVESARRSRSPRASPLSSPLVAQPSPT